MNDPDNTQLPNASPASRRADIAALLVGLTLPSVVTLIYFVLLDDALPWVQQAAYGICKGTQFALPVFWVFYIRRNWPRWHLPGKQGMAECLGFGLLIGAAIPILYHTWLASTGLLDAAATQIHDKVFGIGMDTPLKYLGMGVFYALGHSLAEEYYWRWFVFGQLRRLVKLGPAIVISSLGFMAHHVIVLSMFFPGRPWLILLFSAAVAVGGAAWAWLYHRSGSLYGPWFSHALVDAGIFLLGYSMAFGV
ncbi:MAG: CPBP family intramembrane metalloprotease [Candidatus Nealsonbacteria bacterium]|nr:CPBP family intramembrane metalloprotease [Candidatus Nealsonbacteria bacterium]